MSENRRIPDIRFLGFTDDWEQSKFGEYYSFKNGLNKEKEFFGYGTPIVNFTDVFHNRGIYSQNLMGRVHLTWEEIANYSVKKGDVFFTRTSETIDEIGHPSVMLDDPKDTVFSGFILRARAKREDPLDLLFKSYVFFTSEFRKEMKMKSSMTTRALTSGTAIKKMEFCYPKNKEEQHKIGTMFKQLDNLITLHQRKYNKILLLKKAMLQKMFPKEGEVIPEVRFTRFTKEWEQRKFEEIFCERREKTVIENEDTLLSCAIDGMFLNTELFSHFRGSSNIGYLKVKKNDLILSAQNLHLGNANVNLRFESGIISPAYKVYDLVESDPSFVQAWVKKDETKKFFLNSTTEGASGCRKNVEWKTLNKQTIPTPQMEEQILIGKYFTGLDNLITLYQNKLEKLKSMKKSMLEKMFV